MRNGITLFMAALAVSTLASCYEQKQTFALNAAERVEPETALQELIATPLKRDQVFFANPDFSEKQVDYLKGRLAELPHPDRNCVENSLRESFGERMAACVASQKWTFLCGGCERIADSIMYDPAAMVSGMHVCGVDVELPRWE